MELSVVRADYRVVKHGLVQFDGWSEGCVAEFDLVVAAVFGGGELGDIYPRELSDDVAGLRECWGKYLHGQAERYRGMLKFN